MALRAWSDEWIEVVIRLWMLDIVDKIAKVFMMRNECITTLGVATHLDAAVN